MFKVNPMRRAYLIAAMIIASFIGTSASAQTPLRSVATKQAATSKPAKKAVVSPYARAAAQRERNGLAPAGHPQPVGRAHRPSKPVVGGRPQ
ncbi:MAG TPA: hypothetical protein VGO37_07705 [Steroidobacteraceae bacterium]|jgi:hypothetical protein|nr:hypothetical protein [Steroidobacteraceae bacterium]